MILSFFQVKLRALECRSENTKFFSSDRLIWKGNWNRKVLSCSCLRDLFLSPCLGDGCGQECPILWAWTFSQFQEAACYYENW